jgi:hypothetical protein
MLNITIKAFFKKRKLKRNIGDSAQETILTDLLIGNESSENRRGV